MSSVSEITSINREMDRILSKLLDMKRDLDAESPTSQWSQDSGQSGQYIDNELHGEITGDLKYLQREIDKIRQQINDYISRYLVDKDDSEAVCDNIKILSLKCLKLSETMASYSTTFTYATQSQSQDLYTSGADATLDMISTMFHTSRELMFTFRRFVKETVEGVCSGNLYKSDLIKERERYKKDESNYRGPVLLRKNRGEDRFGGRTKRTKRRKTKRTKRRKTKRRRTRRKI